LTRSYQQQVQQPICYNMLRSLPPAKQKRHQWSAIV
jgi:hypothetical protein